MRQIQASEAKSRFLQILDEVEQGDTVVITRHGKPVARLSPETERRRAEIAQTIEDIRTLGRSNGPITVEEILAARDEGRKY